MAKKFQIDYEMFCKEVMSINYKIRFAALLDKKGKRIAGGYRENISSYLSPHEVNMSLYYAHQRWENRGKLSNRIGDARYSLTEYEKVKQITIPIGKRFLLLISTEINANHLKIMEKISMLIDDHFRGLLLIGEEGELN